MSVVLTELMVHTDPEVSRQFTIDVFATPLPPSESEDCLYLNVFTPTSRPPPGGFPVMFWIYGGALQFGYSGDAAYDGSYFAAFQDVIVVTTNYRTNGMPREFAVYSGCGLTKL